MKNIVVQYSGWCIISADCAKFQNVHEPEVIITGEEWASLPEEKQYDYILEDLIATIRDCKDNEWTEIDVEIEE